MSGVHWADEGRGERVAFVEDAPKASEGLRQEKAASSLLDRTPRVKAAGLSGAVKMQTPRQQDAPSASVAHGAEASDWSGNKEQPASVARGPNLPQPQSFPDGLVEDGQPATVAQGRTPPTVTPARRAVEIKPFQPAFSTQPRPPSDNQTRTLSASVSQGAEPEQPVSEVIPVGRQSRPGRGRRVVGGLVRRAGQPGFLQKRLNRVSTVNEVYSRWAQDDPVAEGTTSTVRGAVQAEGSVHTVRQFGAWTWQTSRNVIRGTGGFVTTLVTHGPVAAVVSVVKGAGAGVSKLAIGLLGKAVAGLLALLLIVFLILLPILSVIGPGTDMSFGIQGDALDELYRYCTRLDAEWTVRVNRELNTSGYDEVRLNGTAVTDPSSFNVKTNINQLLLYLQVLNASGTNARTVEDLKGQIDQLYESMYSLSASAATETVTETRTVHAGESLGTVVTSAYCNCALCCGHWAGGPTASGVYPQSNHTLAVDAYTPTVPMGTEIIMNGTLYKVEDTGAFSQYGVDFDVYMDSHQEALNWGHRSFEAYLAGDEGTEIQVTVTHTVSIYNVTLTTHSLYSLMHEALTPEQQEHLDLMNEFGAFAGYALGGNPFGEGNRWTVQDRFGSYADGTAIRERNHVSVFTTPGREVFAPLDGTLSWSGDTATLTKGTLFDSRTVIITGLSARHGGGSVAAGALIGTAQSDGITITVLRNGRTLNPVFYLANAPGSGDGQALVDMALTQLGQRGGQPYWSWFGHTSRVAWCSEFVSWCANECGFIDAGLIPKYSYSGNGIQWFREHGQWQPGGYVPNPGDVIFFDWDLDGQPDHTGIVADCDGATVFTVEGNVGDVCREQTHSVNSSSIMGYGTPDYG